MDAVNKSNLIDPSKQTTYRIIHDTRSNTTNK